MLLGGELLTFEKSGYFIVKEMRRVKFAFDFFIKKMRALFFHAVPVFVRFAP